MKNIQTSEGRNSLIGAVTALAAVVIALVLAFSFAPSPASAETPAERCQRETSAYNAAWAALGKKPPVPYKCGGSNEPPPTLSPSPDEDESDESAERTPDSPKTDNSGGNGPSMNGPTERRELEHPEQGQAPITGSESNEREQYLRKLVHRVMDAVDRFKEFDLLSEVEKVDFVKTMRPVKMKQNVDQQTRKTTGCWTSEKRQGWDSRWGYTVYTIWLGFKWCSQKGAVTLVEIYDKGGETGTPGYDFEGIQAYGTKPAGWEGRAYIQAEFSLYDVGGVGALPTITPCLKGIGFADGMVAWRQNPDGDSSCNNVSAPA